MLPVGSNADSHNEADDLTLLICRLYAQTLGLRSVAPDDDFFALGGTSLTAVELLDNIRSYLHIHIPARTFYQATAVYELVDVARGIRDQEDG